MNTNQSHQSERTEFAFNLTNPYSAFTDEESQDICYLADGLIPETGLTVIAAKPKAGKSSLSRYLAVAVSKGAPFLGRQTLKGGALLLSFEDSKRNVATHLTALGWDPATDSPILVSDRMGPNPPESLAGLRAALRDSPDTRLVVVDHLGMWLQLKDMNDYGPVQQGVKALRDIGLEFGVVIVAISHCKKSETSDVFDSILGSTAIRGAADSTLLLHEQKGRKVLSLEGRGCRQFLPSLIDATTTEVHGVTVVSNYTLQGSFDEWAADHAEESRQRQTDEYVERVLSYLVDAGGSALQRDLFKSVVGRAERKTTAVDNLIADRMITAEGSPRMLTICADPQTLAMYRIGKNETRG